MVLLSSDLYSREYRVSPEHVWEEMRNDHPLFYDDIGKMWWVTRYEDVKNVFSDHETFSSSTYDLTTGQVVGPTLIGAFGIIRLLTNFMVLIKDMDEKISKIFN